jgi:hypothetical protein
MAVDLQKLPRAFYDFTADWDKFRASAPKEGVDLKPVKKAALLTQSFRGFADALQQFDAKFLLLQKLAKEIGRNPKPSFVNEAVKLHDELEPKCKRLKQQSEDLEKLLKEVDGQMATLINDLLKTKQRDDKKKSDTLRVAYQGMLGPLRSAVEQSTAELTKLIRELAERRVDLERPPEPALDEDHIICPHCKRALSIEAARRKMGARA